ncbi:Exosome complex exonuclease RRP44 [Alteripontixanthobacter maritimus]|uniref:Ribonuclease R n=1 Tax=Alteripontixanthobacter maritimus TaxID=2161824 RepID=A0A369Q694_9SPHN|nr:ribonuclease R [Alteripontixanthobacter maritimus]RDC59950.1 Exosome complex exonuclease RRP44 [Alteripontixanthobacter maritimus]
MKKQPKYGLPTPAQVLEFLQTSTGQTGKREIAKAFGLKGQEKIALKKLLKDMAEEGLIDGRKTAFHKMGGVPKVSVLKVVEIEDGEAIAVPESWQPDDGTAPPRLRLIERKKGGAVRVGHRVLARTEQVGKGWQAHVMKVLPERTEGLMGVVEVDAGGTAWLAPVDKRVRHSSEIKDLGGAEKGQLVLAEPAGRSPKAGVNVIEVLGDPLAPKSFSLIAIAKHGIRHVFPDEVLAEAEIAAKLPLSIEDREDLRQLPIVAIDPADARDHDDAIWAEPDGEGGFDALVAIADVSFYVRPGSEIDREARKRGNSVYFPDRVVPMLPEVLSADVCSLKSGEDRAAMACHLKIDKDGEITGWRFTRAIVRIEQVIAYEDAQAAIDADTAPEYLRNLWRCWKLLSEARSAREPLDLDLPERRVMLDDEGKITEIAVRERLDAHRVVEDFMIAANVASAKALEAKNAPVVYRIHETPSREKLLALKEYLQTQGRKLALGQVVTPGLFNRFLKDVADENEKALLMEAVLRSQARAEYNPANVGHFGLALASYSHFTSPIRRYADLLLHRSLVDAFKLEQPAPKAKLPAESGLSDRDREDLSKITDIISQAERRAMEAERDTVDRYVAAWLSGRVGETFETRITGVQSFGFFATILGLGGDGLVPVSTLGNDYFKYDEKAQALVGERSGQSYTTGDRLKLRLGEANPLTGAMKFEPLDADGNPIEPRGRKPAPGRSGSGKARGAKGKRDGSGAKPAQGKRGRPSNIRHQGRKKGGKGPSKSKP